MNKTDEKRLNDIYSLMKSPDRSTRDLIESAYFFSKGAHRGTKRASGRPYFDHAYCTAKKLAELGMGPKTIAAGFLHDTVEDTATSENEIKDKFGKEILFLVQGVTKLGKLKYHGLKRHTESLRKLFIAMAQDIRVLIVKLADRLHNMETLDHIPEEKRERIALETLEIYAPLAHRLGIGSLKGDLEDLAFPYVYPEEYESTKKFLKQESRRNIKRLEKLSRTLKRKLADEGIRIVKTDYRIKHLYSMRKKLKKYDMNMEKVYDIAALRVIVPTQDNCYSVLGVIHERWKPLPGRIKDYIATPKHNEYQSLHTTVFTGDGGIVEIQIRTPEMHREAEFGIASHVSYKEGFDSESSSLIERLLSPFGGDVKEKNKNKTPKWVKQFVDTQKGVEEPQEFFRNLKVDFFGERVFVFTPKGEVVDLPADATPIDFAYAIHTDIGDHLSGAKVNGKLASIDEKLENGDIVEIETKESAKPTRKWLETTKTTLAIRKIKAHLQKGSK